eukprot:NODE_2708_length_1057_cov_13.946429_g2258_i0.p1 GENE.NODE_2708_length_1057_cov_13.946429_g2258_i0~~NODE_2708_length_1057_cov_13.946429_g2258_i0.p1  ORF type:complete len:228 (-),score=43.25 NODE_2708_length_1057_cov_13.946429_g2258_i0:202-885(-)
MSGALHYVVVARRAQVFADAFASGQATGMSQAGVRQASRQVLEKIPPNNANLSYSYETFFFHYIVADGITYLCLADQSFGIRVPFAFLEEVKRKFTTSFPHIGSSGTPAGVDRFSKELQSSIDATNRGDGDKFRQTRGEIQATTRTMTDNIDKLLDRGEKISLLVDRTADLQEQSFKFKRSARTLKNSMWRRNLCLTAIIVIIILIVIFIITTIACGGLDYHKCRKK